MTYPQALKFFVNLIIIFLTATFLLAVLIHEPFGSNLKLLLPFPNSSAAFMILCKGFICFHKVNFNEINKIEVDTIQTMNTSIVELCNVFLGTIKVITPI